MKMGTLGVWQHCLDSLTSDRLSSGSTSAACVCVCTQSCVVCTGFLRCAQIVPYSYSLFSSRIKALYNYSCGIILLYRQIELRESLCTMSCMLDCVYI